MSPENRLRLRAAALAPGSDDAALAPWTWSPNAIGTHVPVAGVEAFLPLQGAWEHPDGRAVWFMHDLWWRSHPDETDPFGDVLVAMELLPTEPP